MSFTLLGILNSQAAGGGGSAFNTWLAAFRDSDWTLASNGVGNRNLPMFSGTGRWSGVDEGIYVRYDADGAITTGQRVTSTGVTDDRIYGKSSDYDGTYIYYAADDEDSGYSSPSIGKFDASDDTIVWSRKIDFGGNTKVNTALPQTVCVNDSGDVALVARLEVPSNDLVCMVWNSAGTLQWAYKYDAEFAFLDQMTLATDGTDFFIAANYDDSSRTAEITKVSAADGSISWSRRVGTALQLLQNPCVVYNSVDETVHLIYADYVVAGFGLGVLTLNATTGATISHKTITGTGIESDPSAQIDADGNLIICGTSETITSFDPSSGTVNWFIKATAVNGSLQIRGGSCDTTNDVALVYGRINDANETSDDWNFTWVLPVDGSFTGTYTLFGTCQVTFTSDTTSVADATYTVSAGDFSAVSVSYTESAGLMSRVANTYLENVVAV